MSLNQVKTRFEETIRQMNREFEEQKRAIEVNAAKEVKRLKDLNRAHRQNLAFDKLPSLSVEEYESLSSRPVTDLSLVQFLAVQLFQLKQNYQETLMRSEEERNMLLEENQRLKTQLNNTSAELITEKELRVSLESRLASSMQRFPLRAEPEPDITEQYRKADNERAELRATYQVALAKLEEANKLREKGVKRVKELEVQVSQDTVEINSLKMQLQAMQTLAERQEALLQQQYIDIGELKKMRDNFFNKFIQSSESRRTELNDMIKNEVEKISQRSRDDVDYIREVTERMRDREMKMMTESHSSAMNENKQLRSDLRKAEQDRSKLQAEYQTLQLAHEAEITRISNDLRMKSYELERVKLVYEELKALHEDLGDDRDALSAKFDIVKQEVTRLENEVVTKDSQIQNLSDKLTMYEKLENELDIAIENMDVGHVTIPADANRRAKQSIQLARRVMQLQTANNQLASECEALKQQISCDQQEISDLKAQLDAAGKPQQVFVDMINQKQQEIQKLKCQLSAVQEMNQELVNDRKSIQEDLRREAHVDSQIKATERFAECYLSEPEIRTDVDSCDPPPFIITRI